MNRKTLLLCCLVGSLSLGFICPPLFAAQPYQPAKKITVPKVQMARFGLKITDVTYRTTERRGLAFRWVATVVNSGSMPVKKDQFVIKGTQSYRSGNAACEAGVGRFAADLLPGKTARVVGSFDYKLTHKLKLDIVANNALPGKPAASRTVAGPRLKADFTEFSLNPDKRRWTATVRNKSTFPARLNLHVHGEEANHTTHGLGNQNTKLLAPGDTQTFTGPLGFYKAGWEVTGTIAFKGQYCGGADARIILNKRTLK